VEIERKVFNEQIYRLQTENDNLTQELQDLKNRFNELLFLFSISYLLFFFDRVNETTQNLNQTERERSILSQQMLESNTSAEDLKSQVFTFLFSFFFLLKI
jgi:primosomal protein N''